MSAPTANEAWTQSRDGARLFYRHWPVENATCAVAIIPGYADHSGRYSHVADFLTGGGIEVYALDLRGHGNSDGARGHVSRFDHYHDDVDALLSVIAEKSQGKPLFILGHSMGGLVALSYAIRRSPDCKGIAVSSPFLGVAMKVPEIKVLLGRVMSVVYPSLALPSGLNPYDLSHDRAVGDAYSADPLVFKTATARWFTETMRAIAETKAGARNLKLPCLILQAGDDRLADPEASKPLFDSLGSSDRTYIEYPNFYHEIFNEDGKEKPMGDLINWIKARIGT